jgi:hypothetical protein
MQLALNYFTLHQLPFISRNSCVTAPNAHERDKLPILPSAIFTKQMIFNSTAN